MTDQFLGPPVRGGLGSAFRRLVNRIVMPSNAQSGQQRMEWNGGTTPPELQAYGITNAILGYIVDPPGGPNPGVEVGYFFMGITNHIDSPAPGFRAMVFGNVTYPTPGVPSSATVLDVKTNFQQDAWAQGQSTIFKDHKVEIWSQNLLMRFLNQIRIHSNNDATFAFIQNANIAPGDNSLNINCVPGILNLGFGTIAYNGVDQGQGLFDQVESLANSGGVAVETSVFSSAVNAWLPQRTYMVEVIGQTNNTVANTVIYNIRRNSAAGPLLVGNIPFPVAAGAGFVRTEFRDYIRNATNASIVDNIVVTLQPAGGAGLANMAGAGTIPRRLRITDVGSAAQYPSTPQI